MCNVETLSKIAAYLQVPEGKLSYNKEKTVTRTNKAETISGFTTILTALAKESKSDAATNSFQSLEIQAQVQQWIDYTVLYIVPGCKDKQVVQHLLRDLNQHFATRSYIVGQFITLADLAVFHGVINLVKSLSPIEKENFLNLSRWFDHLQQCKEIRRDDELVNFTTIYLHGWATGTHV